MSSRVSSEKLLEQLASDWGCESVDELIAAHAHDSVVPGICVREGCGYSTEVEPGPMFRQKPHRALGKRLRELLHTVTEPGYPGDRLVTDAWAAELGLRG